MMDKYTQNLLERLVIATEKQAENNEKIICEINGITASLNEIHLELNEINNREEQKIENSIHNISEILNNK